jgi:hypothetical protein
MYFLNSGKKIMLYLHDYMHFYKHGSRAHMRHDVGLNLKGNEKLADEAMSRSKIIRLGGAL